MTMNFRSRWLAMATALLLWPLTVLAADPPPPPQNNPVWQKLRTGLFQARPISDDGNKLIELKAPERAEDAAVVPLSIKTKVAQTPERYIKTISVILDNNPAPVAAVFHMTPDTGRADIETRVRVEQYTHLRAVVEMNDGSLSMPAGRETTGPATNLGKMRLTIEENPKMNQPVMAQLMIRHPNLSGLTMDQITRLYEPPKYVRKIEVAYAGKPVMTADVDFSISENPNFRFYFTPKADGMLTAQVQDSDDLTFKTSLNVKPQ